MWDKIKEVIFHRVVQKGTVAAVAAGVAWVSKPDVVAALGSAGITVDPTKLSAAAIMGVTFVLTLVYHFIEHKVRSGSTAAPKA